MANLNDTGSGGALYSESRHGGLNPASIRAKEIFLAKGPHELAAEAP